MEVEEPSSVPGHRDLYLWCVAPRSPCGFSLQSASVVGGQLDGTLYNRFEGSCIKLNRDPREAAGATWKLKTSIYAYGLAIMPVMSTAADSTPRQMFSLFVAGFICDEQGNFDLVIENDDLERAVNSLSTRLTEWFPSIKAAAVDTADQDKAG